MKIIANVGGMTIKGQETAPGIWLCSPKHFAQFVDETGVPNPITILGGTQMLETEPVPERASHRQQVFIWLVNRYSDEYLGGESIREMEVYDIEGTEEEIEIEDEESIDAEQVVY